MRVSEVLYRIEKRLGSCLMCIADNGPIMMSMDIPQATEFPLGTRKTGIKWSACETSLLGPGAKTTGTRLTSGMCVQCRV